MGHGVSCARTGDEHDYFRAAQLGDLDALAALYDRLSALHIAAANGRIEDLSASFGRGCGAGGVRGGGGRARGGSAGGASGGRGRTAAGRGAAAVGRAAPCSSCRSCRRRPCGRTQRRRLRGAAGCRPSSGHSASSQSSTGLPVPQSPSIIRRCCDVFTLM
uniref:Uncharacterized protein n=2 Tax=Setaria viridis TaxID=4556 RepID=A0A4U6WGG2_SETVI|nr:high affinity cGMP-specific 3',5'-cyclic phosphodiesterase 9A-like [Setaria viridis]TKW40318.1 hypothetical protein SEVIR_1G237800v2 [Setaria viridis]TKW40319.1 hypothetical protein SEVIR_1G237800v2 [Setaria viridis]